MSSVITGLLSSTFGLLLNKARDYAAEKLKEGDLTDHEFRKIIVSDVDDIKSKLDASARKDLLSSVSFLKEGVPLLNLSVGESSHNETRQDIGQAEAVINEALPLALLHEVRRLNLFSEKRFQSAKALFEKSNTEATRAFNNEALSTEDRILAAKLRMISRILESLEDPDAAASACQLYLQDLHAMPAVQEIFSVHVRGGMKSLFYKTERLENVKSVTMINYVLFQFIDKFTKTQRPCVFSWPGIEIGERSYYPLYEESEILGGELVCQKFTCGAIDTEAILVSTVNSNGEIIIASKVSSNTNVINRQGETKLFCSLPQEDTKTSSFLIHSLAIDGEDNVYIVTSFQQINKVYSFKLFVFDAEGNLKHRFPLEFLKGGNGRGQIAINMPNDIIIHKFGESRVYVCNNKGQLQYRFPLEENVDIEKVHLGISDKTEIVVASRFRNAVYIYTEEGKLMRTIKLPKHHEVSGVEFNYKAKKVIVCTKESGTYYLLSYSETQKLQTLLLPNDVEYYNAKLTSHPNGPVALVHQKGVVFF